MTATERESLDGLVLAVYDNTTAPELLETVRNLYAEVYAEPPYCDGPAEVEAFASRWPRRLAQAHFRLVIADDADEPIAFTFGHQLAVPTRWWDGAVEPLPDSVTTEHDGRTFAIIEMGVRQPHRRRGVAAQLHAHLTAGLPHERTTLLVHPEADAPRRAYTSWGYRSVGLIRPYADGPILDAMIKTLNETERRGRSEI